MDVTSIVFTDLSQFELVEGRRFEVEIYCASDEDYWVLEVINDEGVSFLWDDPFAADKAALHTLLAAFEN